MLGEVKDQKTDLTSININSSSLQLVHQLALQPTKIMRFDWNDDKSQLLKRTRGYSLEEVANILSGHYVERTKRDDPEQFIGIGYLDNTLVSVIYLSSKRRPSATPMGRGV